MIAKIKRLIFKNNKIETPRLILRQFKPNDRGAVLEYSSNHKALQYLLWESHADLYFSRQNIIDFCRPNQNVFAITLKQSDLCIGSVDLQPDHDNNKTACFYILNPTYWGQGYASEALGGLIRYAFEELHLNRVEATRFSENTASGKVMEKCGMLFEGVGKQELFVRGEYRDIVHCAITREMWSKNMCEENKQNI